MSDIMKRNNGQAATFGSVIDHVFQNNLTRFFDDDFWGFKGINSHSQVPVNLRETDNSYELELVAPGLRKEDFRINVSGDTLTVSFEHEEQPNNSATAEGWLRREYRKQSFSRSFQLGDAVDAGAIAARYENGMLQLVLPKNEKAKQISRSISIQ